MATDWIVTLFCDKMQNSGCTKVFRAYAFNADDNSFCVLMLASDWTRLRAEMIWTLWNTNTLSNVKAFASAIGLAGGLSCLVVWLSRGEFLRMHHRRRF